MAGAPADRDTRDVMRYDRFFVWAVVFLLVVTLVATLVLEGAG